MKIGILGAPGSGKTELANQLDIELSKLGYDPFLVVDNYVNDLRIDTDLEYGEFGNLIDDLQVVFKRRECELMYRRKKQNTITCGTVLDSVAHNLVREEEEQARDKVGLHLERLKAIAATLGLLYMETWDYDYAFLMPSDDLLGRALIELLSAYRAPVFTFLPEVTDDRKANVAAETIRALEEEPIAPPDERGVRRGSEDGETDGGSSESVSDLPEQRGTPDDA